MDEYTEANVQVPVNSDTPVPMDDPMPYDAPKPSARCPFCGADVQQGQQFCTFCGRSIAGMENMDYQTQPVQAVAPVLPAPRKKKVWLYVLIGVSAFVLNLVLIILAVSAVIHFSGTGNVAIMEEEKMIFGTWELSEILDPYTGDPMNDKSIEGEIVFHSNLSGEMNVNGQTADFTWFYLYIDEDGDYYYFLRDDSQGADMYYVKDYNEMWVYSEEYWLVYTPEK